MQPCWRGASCSVHSQTKRRHDEQNPGRRGCLYGWECGWKEWEWGRNWQSSCSILHWQRPVLCVREADAAGFLFSCQSCWDGCWGGKRGASSRWFGSGNQMNNLGVWQTCLGVRHRLGDGWFCLVILQINTGPWCVALMGIASYQWVMVCLAAHGDWGSTAGLASKD